MRRSLLIAITLSPLIASDLSTLLLGTKNNHRIEASRLEAKKSKEQLAQVKTAYYPTLNATALYRKKDKANIFDPKTMQGIELETAVTLFDGFRREATLDAIHTSIDSAVHNLQHEEQTILFETIVAYYDYFNAKSRLDALHDKQSELTAQVERYSILVKNELATKDILKSLIASKLEAQYDEQSQTIALERSRKNLELLTGSPIDTLEYKELHSPVTTEIHRADLEADRAMIKTLQFSEDRFTYLPTLSIQGKHRQIDYKGYDTMGGTNVQPENQNEVTASLSMTLFDMGSIAKEREQSHLATLKAKKLIEYKTKSIRNEAEIAHMSLQAAQNGYKAAKAEEEARLEAFTYVKKRFEAGLLNTTTYLSELTSLSQSHAKVKNAIYAEQIAKANLAYTYGIDLMTLIEEKK